ncbi:MAG: hypothetical protein SVK08_02335 [Halobacteriota archaeon]|nr:hypothetical protein [Halobacteriota archaeon]
MMLFIRSEKAASVVISVVLLFGLLAGIAAIVNSMYIPEWRRSAEAEHMNDLFEDLADFKSNADLIIAVSPDTERTITNKIRMGGGSIPVISPAKSGGTLRTDTLRPDIFIAADNYSTTFTFLDLGSIELESSNLYEVDRTYIYENGALILSQMNRSIMVMMAPITLNKYNNGTNRLTVQLLNMSLKNSSIGSSGIEEIVFTYESSTVRFQGLTNNVSLSIATDYQDAWKEFFSDRAVNAGFDASEFDVSTSGTVELNLYGDVELTVVETRASGGIRPIIGTSQ